MGPILNPTALPEGGSGSEGSLYEQPHIWQINNNNENNIKSQSHHLLKPYFVPGPVLASCYRSGTGGPEILSNSPASCSMCRGVQSPLYPPQKPGRFAPGIGPTMTPII